ncbi:MAG: hypothetical protein BGO95_01010 [Micrococcales bacterium 73-13]|nr:MAG: hypothetical protein BGO95_01010 [Micrococcales bacterium 73-13]
MTGLELDQSAAVRLSTALWRARGDHVARLAAVTSTPDGRVRVEVEEGTTPLREVLAGDLRLGEAVTVLVPLAGAVDSVSRAGLVHDAIGVEAVRFDDRGAPVLGAFEAARVPDPGMDDLAAPTTSGGGRHVAAYRRLAEEVLDAVRPLEEERDPLRLARALLAELEVDGSDGLGAFAERMLGIAAPEPVRLRVRPETSPHPEPAVRPTPSSSASSDRRVSPSSHPRVPPIAASGPIGRRWAPERRREIVRRLRGRLGAVRPRFWIPAVAVASALVLAAVLVPADPEPPPLAPAPSGAPAPTHFGEPAAAAAATSSSGPATIPADPAAAALQLRADAVTADVVDDYGDVVLLRLGTAAGEEDVLIERADAGWRLRETLPEPG